MAPLWSSVEKYEELACGLASYNTMTSKQELLQAEQTLSQLKQRVEAARKKDEELTVHLDQMDNDTCEDLELELSTLKSQHAENEKIISQLGAESASLKIAVKNQTDFAQTKCDENDQLENKAVALAQAKHVLFEQRRMVLVEIENYSNENIVLQSVLEEQEQQTKSLELEIEQIRSRKKVVAETVASVTADLQNMERDDAVETAQVEQELAALRATGAALAHAADTRAADLRAQLAHLKQLTHQIVAEADQKQIAHQADMFALNGELDRVRAQAQREESVMREEIERLLTESRSLELVDREQRAQVEQLRAANDVHGIENEIKDMRERIQFLSGPRAHQASWRALEAELLRCRRSQRGSEEHTAALARAASDVTALRREVPKPRKIKRLEHIKDN